jgi:hypothetical protein
VEAQKGSSTAVKGGRWSDPAAWSDRKVPVAGTRVTIGKGMDVVLDASTPALRSLTINVTLGFETKVIIFNV